MMVLLGVVLGFALGYLFRVVTTGESWPYHLD